MFRRIYFDNAATTPVHPDVVEAMMPYLTEKFGNASSIHNFGQETRAAVDRARQQVADLIAASPNEITFTSGGTEANNLAIRGLVESIRRKSPQQPLHIICTTIEHPAVSNVFEDLESIGIEATYVPVSPDGLVDVADVTKAIRPETALVSIMMANNEIGTIQPVAEIGRHIRQLRESGHKIWFHTDAVQAAGKISVDVNEIACDLLSLSAHKINAPKGIGCLYTRRGVRLHPQNLGGRQERGRRGGTEPVHLAVAFGKAAEIAKLEINDTHDHLLALRTKFEDGIFETVSGTTRNGDAEKRLPGISNISFTGIEGEGLLINLDMQGIAVSTGSACSSGSLEPSPIIRALGRDDESARGAIRFSFGRFNTIQEVDHALEIVPEAIETLRRMSPRYQKQHV